MLITRTTVAAPPVAWAAAQPYLKANSADQTVVESLISAATLYAEEFTGRAARAVSWQVLREDFYEPCGLAMRIPIADVATVTEVARLVSGSYVAISASVYQLKRWLSYAEIVERTGQAWPTDADDDEYPVRVTVAQAADAGTAQLMATGILRHVAALWADRGDAEAAMSAGAPDGWTRTLLLESAKQSGAEALYAGLGVPSL